MHPVPAPRRTPRRSVPAPDRRAAGLAFAAILAGALLVAASPPPPQRTGLPEAPPPTGIRPSRPAEPARSEPAPHATPNRGPGPRQAQAGAFGLPLTIEVRDLPRADADAALRAAVAELREIEALTDADGEPDLGGLARLNAAAGGEPVDVDARFADLLQRALTFCAWSDRALGPLGGRLNALWGVHGGASALPTGASREDAARAADCGGLLVDDAAARARLHSGAVADLWGFARGFAVDRAAAVLTEHGAENFLIELGQLRRAAGDGEDGRGWPVLLPVFPGLERPLGRLWLQDESLAVASAVHRPLILAGDRYAPWIDQRSGSPAKGVMGVVAVTELAVDAEALSASLMILGNREGMLRVGGLKPTPAVLWLLGEGDGTPVLSQYNWSTVALR
jgi:thiamine biosynthesis lipoprotein